MGNRFLTEKKPVRVVAKDHSEWLALRSGIGSSDVAAILGYNKYCTPYRLWQGKMGLLEPQPETDLMWLGHELEPIIAKKWSKVTKKSVIPWTESEYMYIHPEYDFMRVSPDREFGDGRTEGILECKSTQVMPEDTPPEYWFCQVQYQMGIAQIDYCNIAYLVQGREFGYYEVAFSPEFFGHMVEEVKRFWYDHILTRKPPECKTVEDLAARYPHSAGKDIEATEGILIAYSKAKEIREEKRKWEQKEKVVNDQLKMYMRDCDRLTYQGQTLCTWKSSKDRTAFDLKRFREENKDLYDRYLTKEPGTRPFLIK